MCSSPPSVHSGSSAGGRGRYSRTTSDDRCRSVKGCSSSAFNFMHETPAGGRPKAPIFHKQFCHSSAAPSTECCQKGIPSDICSIVQGKTSSMFAQPETLDIYNTDYSFQKNETVCFWRRRFCLCRPDVYTTACRSERGAA